MDAVDLAMIRTDGVEIFGFGSTAVLPYDSHSRQVLATAQGRWPGQKGTAAAERIVLEAHLRALRAFEPAELIGFHGQTLAHDPERGQTYQAGDGQKLSDGLRTPVVWDFRSEDLRLGGEGAPLAPFYHFALAKFLGVVEPLVFLNLGGIGNVSWVDPTKDRPEESGALLAFDTGPGNALLDELMIRRTGARFDGNGRTAASGQADARIVRCLLQDDFFRRSPPKSLDRSHFLDGLSRIENLDIADAAATLLAFTVEAIILSLDLLPSRPGKIIVSGGGANNATLLSNLVKLSGLEVKTADSAGLSADFIEAQAFGYLAARVMNGLPLTCPGTTGVTSPAIGARVSYPRSTN